MDKFLLVVIGCLVGFAVGNLYHAYKAVNARDDRQIETQGGDVLNHVCSTKGCSFLIEHKNGTVTWEYAPKLIND